MRGRELRPRLWKNSEGIIQKNYDTGCKIFYSRQALYFRSWYRSMRLSAVATIAVPAVKTVAREGEVVMVDWMQNFRLVWKGTVRGKTSKGKGGSLSSAVFYPPKQTEHSHVEFDTKQATPDDSSTTSPVTKTTKKSARSPGIDELQAINFTFVYNLDISEVQVQDIQQQNWDRFIHGKRKWSWISSNKQDMHDQLRKSSRCICALCGWQGWPSSESTSLPPMWHRFNFRTRCHMWIESLGSSLCSDRLFPE